jgi:hypothetical protein
MSDDPLNYAAVKALAGKLGRPMATMVAQSLDLDPFMADRPGRRLDHAKWFAALWERLELPHGVHMRRIHYRLVVTLGIKWPNGRPFRNTQRDWKRLCTSGADARYLGLVPIDAFVDRRAPEPIVFVPTDIGSDSSLLIHGADPWLPEGADGPWLHYEPRQYDFPSLPSIHLSEPKVADPYAIELAAEKSTMNDILLPIARNLGVTLVTGIGDLSITHCHAMVRRIQEHGRPTRILYISDHDPQGECMPVSVARKLEFFLRREGCGDLDVRLHPIVLTPEQVVEYNLPRAPIKDSDGGKRRFEERHGTGATELDALEELHPGELRRIIESAIDRYRKPVRRLRSQITKKGAEVRRQIRDIQEGVLDQHSDAIAELRDGWDTAQSEIAIHQEAIADALAECRETIAEHKEAIEEQLDQWRESAEPQWQQIADDLLNAAPDPREQVKWPQLKLDGEDPDPLFDSRRDYVTQIDRFKRHQGKPISRRENGGRFGR